MLILFAVLLITAVATGIYWRSADRPGWFMLAAFGWMALLLYAIGVPCQRVEVHSRIVAMQAAYATPRGQDYDSAAWRSKIADYNAQIAKWKYYNRNPVFDIFIPDEVDTLEYLK